ncbi:UNVERIFIED_CONTAM: hypothetical protein GTU68_019165, partial [Idotea baltica]|nr:hypothetical protein [Idotea baltica]
GYIENEVDLNSRGSCGQKCSNYKHAKSVGCYLPDKQYCGKHRRCKGNVHDCKFFHADATVCISDKPYRRYDWITYEDQQKFGRQGTCNNLMKVDSWWRFLYHCSYCICLCDDQYSPTSDRYISLRPVVSDVAEGMIVTGIKFTKVKGVIHMQVQQGKAMAQGQVNHETLRWVEVDPIAVGTKEYVENVDYFTLMYEARNIDLDHLKAPKRHVVTGVKFRMLGSHVNMEMWVTPINFTTGEMTPTMSYWISNDNTPVMTKNPREELRLNDVDDPRKSKSESLVDSRSDMFVTLQPTSLQADVAQLTVPFFDAQPVAPNPSSWLEGLQMYHRGRSGFGGFIGFRIFNYNLTYHFGDM